MTGATEPAGRTRTSPHEPDSVSWPDSLSRGGRRRVLATLCVTELVSWGVLFYAFPVLLADISADTGWSTATLTAGFSAALVTAAVVGVPVGRRLDRYGPRWIMSLGSLLAAPALVLVALAPSLPFFIGGWLFAGIAMGAVLYPPAFAALTRWYGAQRVKALTMLTLAGGLASTVFAPLTALLSAHLSWRHTYLALAIILAVITIPAHLLGLRGRWPRSESPRTTDGSDRTELTGISRSLPFVALVVGLALVSFAALAVVINLVPLLLERGISTGTAAVALGLGGAGQVLGRLAYPPLARRTGVRVRTGVILLATAVTTAVLGWVTSVAALVITAIVAGMARGLLTLVQATAVSDRWGTEHYGRLTGILSAPITLAIALAPWGGSALAGLLGTYAAAFLLLAALGVIGTAFAFLGAPTAKTTRGRSYGAGDGRTSAGE